MAFGRFTTGQRGYGGPILPIELSRSTRVRGIKESGGQTGQVKALSSYLNHLNADSKRFADVLVCHLTMGHQQNPGAGHDPRLAASFGHHVFQRLFLLLAQLHFVAYRSAHSSLCQIEKRCTTW